MTDETIRLVSNELFMNAQNLKTFVSSCLRVFVLKPFSCGPDAAR